MYTFHQNTIIQLSVFYLDLMEKPNRNQNTIIFHIIFSYPQNRTVPHSNEQSGLRRGSTGLTVLLTRTCTGQRSRKDFCRPQTVQIFTFMSVLQTAVCKNEPPQRQFLISILYSFFSNTICIYIYITMFLYFPPNVYIYTSEVCLLITQTNQSVIPCLCAKRWPQKRVLILIMFQI